MSDASQVAAPETDELVLSEVAQPPERAISTKRFTGSRLAAWFLPPLVYLAAAVFNFSQYWQHPAQGIPGGPDGLIYAWYFEWVQQAIVHGHNPLITDAMNLPVGVNVMWNTATILLAVICVPLTATLGATKTVLLLMTLAPALSATACYFALRRITGNSAMSAVAASIYGFGPFFHGQHGHLHLTMAMFLPLLVLVVHRLLFELSTSLRRNGIWLGIITGAAMLIGEELVVFGLYLCVIGAVVAFVIAPRATRAHARRIMPALWLGGAIALIIDVIPLGYQLFGPHALRHGVPPSPQHLDLAGVVIPSLLQHNASQADITANANFPANGVENTGYLGWPLVVLVALMTIWLLVRRDRFIWWWLPVALVTVLLSMGQILTVNGHLIVSGPWRVLRYLPFVGGAVIVRLTLVTSLLVALLIAVTFAKARGWKLVVALIVVVACLIPLRPSGRYTGLFAVQTPRFFTTSAVNVITPNSTALLLPVGTDPWGWIVPMAWQLSTHLRFRIIGGYSVFDEDGHMSYHPVVPDYVNLLQDVAKSGTAPTDAALAKAHPSLISSKTDFIVITDQQQNRQLIADTVQRLVGCQIRPVSDVYLCTVSP